MTGKRALALAGTVLLGAMPAAALEVSVSSSLEDVAVGEQFTVTVEVRHDGMGKVPRPKVPPLEHVRVVGDYESSSFSFVNGKATSTAAVQYVMVADREGTYTIGPVTVEKGDEKATSGTVAVRVRPAGQAAPAPRRLDEEAAADGGDGKDLIVLGRVDDEAPWVNQQIVYTFTFLERADLIQLDYQRPVWDGFWAEELDTTEPTEVTFEGRRYRAQRVRTALFPMTPGELEIGPATLRATVAERRRRRDPFDIFRGDRFGILRGGRNVALQTEPVTVNVRALPAEGKPEDFSGAVGRFSLSASCDRESVQAGEAVTLRVTMSGEGSVRGVPVPDLTLLKDFRIYESRSEESSQVHDGLIHGTKVWEYVLVPVTGGDVEIPPVRVSAFDPVAGAYVELASPAVPLRVEASDLDEALARGDDPSVAKERVRMRQRDIRYVKPAPGSFRKARSSPFASPGFLLAHAVPILALAGSTFLRRHRERLRSDVRWARRRRAAREARGLLSEARRALEGGDALGVLGQVSHALRGYVADRLHLSAANLDEADVREGLAAGSVPGADVEELFGLLATCDTARFSPVGTDPDAAADVVRRAVEWIGRSERA